MNIREVLQTILRNAIKEAGFSHEGDLVIDYPEQMHMGDFATPVALKLGKQTGQNPREIACTLVKNMNVEPESIVEIEEWQDYILRVSSESDSNLSKIEVAGPGFINFTLSQSYWDTLRQEVLVAKESWGTHETLAGQTYLVEHSSPNMFKPFHVGHLVNNFVGSALDNIVQQAGAETHVVSFPSDVSPGIAKAVWGLIDLGIAQDFTIEQVGEAYAHGSSKYKENEEVKQAIDAINLALYKQEQGEAHEVYKRGLELSYQYFESITSRLGSSFEQYFPESECEIEGKQIVHDNIDKVFTESEGAIIFEGSKYGLFDNVFINSAGFGTYLCKDIGLLSKKFAVYDFDHSVTVTDIEQKQHFELVKQAAGLINPDWSEKSTYLQHGRLSLTSGKISSRDGGVPLAEDLLEEVKSRALEKMQDRDITDRNEAAERVAQAALKYAILKTATGKNIVFDFEKDLSFEGASGPYIQYAYVRAMSAASAARILLQENESRVRTGDTPELERLLVRYPDMVRRALEDYSPHHIAQYLHELASEFNSWYAQTKIADADNSDMLANIELAEAVAQALQNGLHILGIETVEKM